MKYILLSFILITSLLSNAQLSTNSNASNKRVTVSGKIKDASSGEDLPGASIYIAELKKGAVSNIYGFYSLSVLPGTYIIKYSYIGFASMEKTLVINKDIRLDIELKSRAKTLKTVEISGQASNHNVSSSEMSVVKMDIRTIERVPALMGEVDILKTIQLLPGVHTTGEGSTGYSVRGGGTDQNLILLDEAPVYNASHLMGFFSVFNNDAIKDLKLYKGDIPVSNGGRLASLLDVHQKEGNTKKYGMKGGLGIISSRLMVEGPLQKNKSSFLIAGRRSYADIFLPFAKDTNVRNSSLYFYDINFKANYEINQNNKLYASAYFGKDVISMKPDGDSEFGLNWGNSTVTLRWNHIYSSRFFSNVTFVRSDYIYNMKIVNSAQGFNWKSKMNNHIFKIDNTFFLNSNNTINFGLFASYNEFSPGTIEPTGENQMFDDFEVPSSQAFDYGAYLGNQMKVSTRLKLNYGIRFSAFSNIGPTKSFSYNEAFQVTDTIIQDDWKIYNTYTNWEPRVSGSFLINSSSSVKASYSRTVQYVQLASNSTVGNPLSVWFPASLNVKPQYGDQVAIGYFRNFLSDRLESSVEVFYKTMHNQIDFKDHAQLLLNEQLEGELRYGKGVAYGAEFLLRKNLGDFTGWIAYTLSRSERFFDDINDGNSYLSPFDKTHDISIVSSYSFNKRVLASATWVYGSGATATFPTGRFHYGNMIAPIYSDRNDYRLPAYHRLDLGLTLYPKEKESRKYDYHWVFSIYNVYNRHNTYSIDFGESIINPGQPAAIKTYLFGIIPSATFNFSF